MMYSQKTIKHKAWLIFALWLIVIMCLSGSNASALQLSARSITLSTSKPSAVARHTAKFTIQSASLLGSVQFEYCTNSPIVGFPCAAPSGLNVASASITSQSGEGGFAVHPSSTANNLIITRVPDFVTQPVSTYQFSNIINPSTDEQTVFVRITTYASNDASGQFTDEGSVAFAIVRGVNTSGFVPPYLTFCAAISVAADCSSANGNSAKVGTLSPGVVATASSQFAGSTNDPSGFIVSVNGLTMTSGNNTIKALATPSNSVVGTSQFGINLRKNNSPVSGQDRTGTGSSTYQSNYGNVDQFKFVSGETLTRSLISTEFNVFTVTYLINVSPGQSPGIYTSTVTYTAVASF